MSKRRRDRGWKVVRRKLMQKLDALTGRELNPDKWIFVIGCYNSGTTLLANLLESHPAINGLPREGVEFTDALSRPEAERWPRMWAECVDHVRIAPEAATGNRARRIKSQWSRHVDDSGMIVEKSIANIARLEFLQRYFQPAYFIHIVRNGYAAAEGIRRRARPLDWGRTEFGEFYPIELCAKQWVLSDQYFEAQKAQLKHVLEVSYESLTSEPAVVLDRIADFLELPAFASDIAEREWNIHRVRSKIRNMNADSLARLTREEMDSIESIAGETLNSHGYRRAVC